MGRNRNQAKTVTADSKGRFVLGSEHAGRVFMVCEHPNGDYILTPVVMIPEREAWLYKNPPTLKAVKRGIAESIAGQTTRAGSFAKYADTDVED